MGNRNFNCMYIINFINYRILPNTFNNTFSDLGAGTFDALFNKDKYIESMIYYESKDVSKYIYSNTNNLEDIRSIEYENERLSENNYFYGDLFFMY